MVAHEVPPTDIDERGGQELVQTGDIVL